MTHRQPSTLTASLVAKGLIVGVALGLAGFFLWQRSRVPASGGEIRQPPEVVVEGPADDPGPPPEPPVEESDFPNGPPADTDPAPVDPPEPPTPEPRRPEPPQPERTAPVGAPGADPRPVEPAPAPAPRPKRKVAVNSFPWSELWVDGVHRGNTGTVVWLEVGRHEFILRPLGSKEDQEVVTYEVTDEGPNRYTHYFKKRPESEP